MERYSVNDRLWDKISYQERGKKLDNYPTLPKGRHCPNHNVIDTKQDLENEGGPERNSKGGKRE